MSPKGTLRALLPPLDERLYTGDEGLIPLRQGGSVVFNFCIVRKQVGEGSQR
jgi:hypothetical protein